MTEIKCPNCKEEVSQVEIECTNCSFPLAGTEKEKAIFIGQQIANKSKIGDAQESQSKTQKILYFTGAFQLFNAFRAYNGNLETSDIVFFIILGSLFIVFGFLSSKKPILFISLALGLILCYYALLYFINPQLIFQGIVWKIVIIAFLIYGIYSAFEEKRLKKMYNYLKD